MNIVGDKPRDEVFREIKTIIINSKNKLRDITKANGSHAQNGLKQPVNKIMK